MLKKYHAYTQKLDYETEVVFVSTFYDPRLDKYPYVEIGDKRIINHIGSFERFDDAYNAISKKLMASRSDDRSFADLATDPVFWPNVIISLAVFGLVKADAELLIKVFKDDVLEASRCGGAPDVFLEYNHGIDATLEDVEEAIEYFKDRGINQ